MERPIIDDIVRFFFERKAARDRFRWPTWSNLVPIEKWNFLSISARSRLLDSGTDFRFISSSFLLNFLDDDGRYSLETFVNPGKVIWWALLLYFFFVECQFHMCTAQNDTEGKKKKKKEKKKMKALRRAGFTRPTRYFCIKRRHSNDSRVLVRSPSLTNQQFDKTK